MAGRLHFFGVLLRLEKLERREQVVWVVEGHASVAESEGSYIRQLLEGITANAIV